jgi:hypothetical protein
MPPAGFEPAVPASDRQQTLPLDIHVVQSGLLKWTYDKTEAKQHVTHHRKPGSIW